MREVEIKLFGAFRKYIPVGKIKLHLPEHCTAFQLKQKIHEVLCERVVDYREPSLVFESALATESKVLAEDVLVEGASDLALLPPVCGG